MSAAHFISYRNITYTLLGLGPPLLIPWSPISTAHPPPSPSYSSFHLSFLSVQTAWNARANIVLVTQPLNQNRRLAVAQPLLLFAQWNLLCVVVGGWVKGSEKVSQSFIILFFNFGQRWESAPILRKKAANLLSTEGCQSKLIDWAFNCGSLNGKTC